MSSIRPRIPEGCPVYRVHTGARGRVTGVDSCIATVPAGIYVRTGGGQPAINVRTLGAVLRRLSKDMAANIGERLHHAEWTITQDPGVVEEVGMHGRPDCVRCRTSVDQTLAHLTEHRKDLLVGLLFWAGPSGRVTSA